MTFLIEIDLTKDSEFIEHQGAWKAGHCKVDAWKATLRVANPYYVMVDDEADEEETDFTFTTDIFTYKLEDGAATPEDALKQLKTAIVIALDLWIRHNDPDIENIYYENARTDLYDISTFIQRFDAMHTNLTTSNMMSYSKIYDQARQFIKLVLAPNDTIDYRTFRNINQLVEWCND